jgi:hypothetical protein
MPGATPVLFVRAGFTTTIFMQFIVPRSNHVLVMVRQENFESRRSAEFSPAGDRRDSKVHHIKFIFTFDLW